MPVLRKSWIAVGAAALAAIGISACAMVGSVPLGVTGHGQCASSAGSYYLPKTLLLVTVTETIDAGRKWHDIDVKSRRVPDSRFGFCLDYLARSASDDIVEVKKYKGTHLLGLVSTDALDQSRFVLQTLIRTVFTAISGNPTVPAYARSLSAQDATTKTRLVLRSEFDPFDARHSAEVNLALKDYGFCLMMEPYTVNPDATTITRYCENPRQELRKAGSVDHGNYRHTRARFLNAEPDRQYGSIFYRPRLPYQMQIYLKDNPKVARWRLAVSRAVRLENVAPVLAVRVDRTTFTQRKTTLVFDEGELKNICVYKKSELLALSNIPLQVAQSVVALPTQIAQIRINEADNERALLEAEGELIRAQREMIAFQNDPNAQKPTKKESQHQINQTDPNAGKDFELATRTGAVNICPVDSSVSTTLSNPPQYTSELPPG